eukprot:scaffold359059_cov22-Prasinocladus_malaysianus.AAC.1
MTAFRRSACANVIPALYNKGSTIPILRQTPIDDIKDTTMLKLLQTTDAGYGRWSRLTVYAQTTSDDTWIRAQQKLDAPIPRHRYYCRSRAMCRCEVNPYSNLLIDNHLYQCAQSIISRRAGMAISFGQ